MQSTALSPPPLKSVNTISDLNDLASSNLESIKRQLERSHSETVKDIEASQYRLQKGFKMQRQACQEVMDKAEKEYKKSSVAIKNVQDFIRVQYAEFIEVAQFSASHLCKVSISELAETSEKNIAALRSRFGNSNAA